MRQDIDELNYHLQHKDALIDKLDQDQDAERLELYSRRDTIRVFGLTERLNEVYENIERYVIDSVLKVACPGVQWNEEDIVRAHRVGYTSEQDGSQDDSGSNDEVKPRTLLIKFLRWEIKMKILKGRDALRNVGIRVGDDLTRRQQKNFARTFRTG